MRDGAETPQPTAAARVSGDIAGRRRSSPEPRAPGRRPPDFAGDVAATRCPDPSRISRPRVSSGSLIALSIRESFPLSI